MTDEVRVLEFLMFGMFNIRQLFQNVQYFLLALFWWMSKPVARQ